MGKTCHCRTTSHTKKCLTELLHYYQGKWSKRKQWLAWQLSSNFSLLLSLICTHMGGKGICVNEASQKIAKYSSSLCSDLKTVAHSCKHAIIHVSSACNPMKRRRFPKQNDKKQSNFQENRKIAPAALNWGLRQMLYSLANKSIMFDFHKQTVFSNFTKALIWIFAHKISTKIQLT